MVAGNQGCWFADGEAYEHYIGRWNRPVGHLFLDWLSLPPCLRWVEVGCGTGVVTEIILERTDPGKVTGVEPSEGFISQAGVKITDRRAEFKSGDAMSLPFNDAEADVLVSGLVLNFVPDA